MFLKHSIPLTNYSTPVSWDKLPGHLSSFGKGIIPIQGDGYCFANSISTALLKDAWKNLTREEISEIVMNELVEWLDFYCNFHPGLQNKYQLLKEADLFLNGKACTIDVADVCIAATANALCVNLHIYQNIGNNAVIFSKSLFQRN